MTDILIETILQQNDELIVSLEGVMDSEEKYQNYSYEYPTTMIYHDFLMLIEDTEENFIDRMS